MWDDVRALLTDPTRVEQEYARRLQGDPAEGGTSGTHNISFYCDDVEKTVAELKARGVEFTGPVEDRGYGLVTFFKVPGGFAVQLYQPRYEKKKPGR